MRKSSKFAAFMTTAVALTALTGLSAFAETRHQDETSWRNGTGHARRDDRGDRYRDDRYRDDRRRDERQRLSGIVERVNVRRGVVVLRERHAGRPVVVEMERRRGNRSGVDVDDLRRGDRVTFVGEWERRGFFEASRIARVDTRRARW